MKNILSSKPHQLDLFDHIAGAYESSDSALCNEDLYQVVAKRAGIPDNELTSTAPVGRSGQGCNLLKRKIRWHQQTLKHLGLIERVPDERGLWHLTNEGKHRLRQAKPDVALLAFSTDLGIAIFASCRQVFPNLDVPIHLVVTSPPYPLRKPRAYGNPSAQDYVDFICQAMEPLVMNLIRGGSICLNISNDIFEPGSPARSLYLERLVLALNHNLGLSLMDRLIWHNASKPPGPVQWASKRRFQLNVAWEPVLWFTNDPHHVRSDNRRVLEPHSDRHLRLISRGGEHRTKSFSDGAYTLREGSYSNETPGRIPRNVLAMGHNCPDHKRYRKDVEKLGLPLHGAPMPMSLPDFLIRFLTVPGEMVADPFGGTLSTARAAENLGRKWVATEWILEYMRGAAERFRSSPGFWLNPTIENMMGF